MLKKYYLFAVASFLMIPVVTVIGGMVFSSINPEIAAGYSNYTRIYRLLDLARKLSMLATLLAIVGLWLLTCFFLIKSKQKSYTWLSLALLGPFGFIILSMLNDRAPSSGDLYEQFVGKLKIYVRITYELGFFVVAWEVAYRLMVLKRNLMIILESASTGLSTAQIINQQNASSGMWAFSEGNEVMYLVVLLYLLWPIGFNAAARLPKFMDTL
ncbi:MAG TPA: hypothetical protein VN867_16695 [Candidatus Binataceae bacterium]|nr:hypothetical protein [Candidatus Binataceae bacterium]